MQYEKYLIRMETLFSVSLIVAVELLKNSSQMFEPHYFFSFYCIVSIIIKDVIKHHIIKSLLSVS